MLRPLFAICALFLACPAFAEDGHTIALQIIPLEPFRVGHEQHAIAKLTHLIDGTPVTANELAVSHTKRFHLLVIDEGLEDFQHIHPDMRDLSHADCPKWAECSPGEYPFTWTPKYNRIYRAWADITRADSGHQEYASFLMPHGAKPETPEKNFTAANEVKMGHYRFTLTTDAPLMAAEETMLHLHISDAKGRSLCPVQDNCRVLEPVLGAFAHAVGFNEDFISMLHAHPMGEEPANETSRGAPDLTFHILPPKAGFYRLFVQLSLTGNTLFVPFGIDVKNMDGASMTVIKNP